MGWGRAAVLSTVKARAEGIPVITWLGQGQRVPRKEFQGMCFFLKTHLSNKSHCCSE